MKQQVATLCPSDPPPSVANQGKDGDLSTKTDRWAVIIISCTICILQCLHLCAVGVVVHNVTRFGHGGDLKEMPPAVRISVSPLHLSSTTLSDRPVARATTIPASLQDNPPNISHN